MVNHQTQWAIAMSRSVKFFKRLRILHGYFKGKTSSYRSPFFLGKATWHFRIRTRLWSRSKVPKSEHPKHGQNTHTYVYIYVYYINSIKNIQYLYSWFCLEQIWYIHIYSTADFIPKQFDFGNIGSLCVLNNITENQEPSLPWRMIPKRHLFYSEIHLDLLKMILYFFPWEIHYLGSL